MRLLVNESFDRYGRYAHVWELRREKFGPEPIRILDVGDPHGTLASLFLDDHTVSVDLFAIDEPPVGGHSRLLGSGFELPFPAGSFDLVASHDTLEHLPAERRLEFIDELLRVGRGPVLLVAPFADPRTELCERLINLWYVARLGEPIPPLVEHADFGLPDLAEIALGLDERGVPFRTHGDGWLDHWLAFMLVRGHLLSEGTVDLAQRLDSAFNTLLRERDTREPHYRRVLLLRDGAGAPPAPPAADTVAADLVRLSRVALELSESLSRGKDVASVGSGLRAWLESNAIDEQLAEIATSLTIALDAAQHSIEVSRPPEVSVLSPVDRRVAVVLVNLNGAEHLPTCLDSVAAQDYPRELTEVIVVDNASTDESLTLLAERYPWVRVLPQDTNTGFSPAVNAGVAATDAELVVMLNNDMRVEPDWLRHMVNAYDPDNDVICVGAQILSWDGETLDFGEGSLNFYGMGHQVGYGQQVDAVNVRDQQDLLFACGGAMLIGRDAFVTVGGFDESFFAYFEDVDLGWRLWTLGYRVKLAAEARCYHKMHGTSGRFPDHQRMLLYERNALRSIIKNYDDAHLAAVLGPSLLLLAKRAVTRSDINRADYDIGGPTEATDTVSRTTVAHLLAVADVVDTLDELMESRNAIQSARRRTDEEIIELFGRPLQPVILDDTYVEAQHAVVRAFGLGTLFDRQRATRLVVISSDDVGEKMRGPAVRALEIAKSLSRTVPAVIAVPGAGGRTVSGIETVGYTDQESLREIADAADVVLIQGYTLRRYPALARTPAVLVIDLYDPWLFENLEMHAGAHDAEPALLQDVSVLNELIDNGDFFICASERQRDYWLGMMSARGHLDSAAYAMDPTLRSLIDVVPFGLPKRPPRHVRPVLKGVHPAVAEDDLVVLWGGGTWDWFDPVTVIDAFNIVVSLVPNAKLYFLGLQLESDDVAPMKMATTAIERAKALGLEGTSVIFGDWAPYDLREAFLLEADVAVSAARDLAEARLAFRSRILDYLWAGLPVVTTAGDGLSELVQEERLGVVVPPGDIGLMAHALVTLLSDPVRRADCRARALEVAERFTWDRTVEPLREVALHPWRWRLARQQRPSGRPLTEDVQYLLQTPRRRLDDREEALEAARDEAVDADRLRNVNAELERIIAYKDRPYRVLRKTPIGWAVRAWRRLRARSASPAASPH